MAVLSSTNLFGGYDILPPVDLFGGYDTEGTCCHSQRGNNDDGGAEGSLKISLFHFMYVLKYLLVGTGIEL